MDQITQARNLIEQVLMSNEYAALEDGYIKARKEATEWSKYIPAGSEADEQLTTTLSGEFMHEVLHMDGSLDSVGI
jgi:hypothetical protein